MLCGHIRIGYIPQAHEAVPLLILHFVVESLLGFQFQPSHHHVVAGIATG